MGRPFFHSVNTMIFLLGISCLVIGGYPFKRSYDSNIWPHTFGEITLSRLDNGQTFGDWVLTYQVKLRYQYQIEQQKPQSNGRIEFGIGSQVFFMRDYAERLVFRYPEGKRVRIYYNPANTIETVIERSPSMGSSVSWLVIGLIMAISSFFLQFAHPFDKK